ncbi:Uncharacterised protein [Vibrio cholerae]|nr:Uncharacterised protein [Vibrio cholerae]CSI76749.1 Uncharacterised protein [Vibrio cholerae]
MRMPLASPITIKLASEMRCKRSILACTSASRFCWISTMRLGSVAISRAWISALVLI